MKREGLLPRRLLSLASALWLSMMPTCKQRAERPHRVGAIGGPTGAHYLAVTSVKPEYPSVSLLAGRQGLVVAEIELAPSGRLVRLSILQSPDNDMADAVRAAVTRWKFRGLGKPDIGAIGRLFFYFRIIDGQGVVLTPDELGRRSQ